ncbi:hypothetical protein BH20CHL7_BH20CHL7_10140 [soil metagenome]
MKTILLTGALLALALAACGGSGTTAGPATTSAPTSATTAPTDAPSMAPSAAPTVEPSAGIEGQVVIVKDFTLDPIDVTSGTTVALAVTNEGPTVHNVAIRDDAGELLGTTANLLDGESETLTVELPAGTYVLFCSLPGPESLGIKGTLIVE